MKTLVGAVEPDEPGKPQQWPALNPSTTTTASTISWSSRPRDAVSLAGYWLTLNTNETRTFN